MILHSFIFCNVRHDQWLHEFWELMLDGWLIDR
jgi:hypothetical protein